MEMKNKININGKDFTLEELNELIENSQKNTKEQRFLELFQGLEIRSNVEKYPNSVFYFRGDILIAEVRNSNLWLSYLEVWCIFEEEFNMKYSEIQGFIKSMVEKHFKWKGLTPSKANVKRSTRWKNISNGRDSHLNVPAETACVR